MTQLRRWIRRWMRPVIASMLALGTLAGAEAAMNAYLTWEIGLVEQIKRDGDARFRYVGRG